jgi:hypothetical protein
MNNSNPHSHVGNDSLDDVCGSVLDDSKINMFVSNKKVVEVSRTNLL